MIPQQKRRLLADLADQVGGEHVREIADGFMTSVEESIAALNAACRVHDRGLLARTANQLKQSAHHLGMDDLSELFADLELRSAHADWPALGWLVGGIVAQWDATYDLLVRELSAPELSGQHGR